MVKCLASFSCNGVQGVLGKCLTEDDLDRIGELLASLLEKGLVASDSDQSFGLDEQLSIADTVESLEPEEKPKKKRRKKDA